jgi:hypothetical protein
VVRWDQDEPPPDVWTRWLELRTLATAIPDSRFQEMPWSARRYGPYSRSSGNSKTGFAVPGHS